jgi:hypothetical protein
MVKTGASTARESVMDPMKSKILEMGRRHGVEPLLLENLDGPDLVLAVYDAVVFARGQIEADYDCLRSMLETVYRDRPHIDDVAALIFQELAAGHKITAIKLFRDATGASLKVAKDIVEKMRVRTPFCAMVVPIRKDMVPPDSGAT